MATPEVRNDQTVNERPPEPQDVTGGAAAGGGWFDEFKRVEKVFAVLGGMLFAAMLVAYLALALRTTPFSSPGLWFSVWRWLVWHHCSFRSTGYSSRGF